MPPKLQHLVVYDSRLSDFYDTGLSSCSFLTQLALRQCLSQEQ